MRHVPEKFWGGKYMKDEIENLYDDGICLLKMWHDSPALKILQNLWLRRVRS